MLVDQGGIRQVAGESVEDAAADRSFVHSGVVAVEQVGVLAEGFEGRSGGGPHDLGTADPRRPRSLAAVG